MLRVLAAEFLKIRRKWIWFLVLLGPLGAVGLQGINYALRYDYLMPLYADDPWGRLIGNVTGLMLPSMFIGLAILASMNAGIEHQMNAWKQTLALPVSRTHVFLGKFVITALLLLVSSTLIIVFTIILGSLLGHPMKPPLASMLQAAYYPYLAIMPFVALQTWLSTTMHNQALPLTVGILGTVVSMFAYWLPDWMPWRWPLLENQYGDPLYSVLAGVTAGTLILAVGTLEFTRKDVR
ncbi:ABC transporter permease [Paenibacillus sp. 1P07SE]|uniref:ABC transporter permease n=1 Tax=Paenibacillus sp. 1P07SE TaxID=3132209 RepID=UPI0039A4528F